MPICQLCGAVGGYHWATCSARRQEPTASQTPGPPRMNGSTAIASGNVPGPNPAEPTAA